MVTRPLILNVYLVWSLSLNTTAHIILVFVRFSAGLFRFKFHCFSLTNVDFIQYGTCNVKTWSRSLLKIRLGYFMLLISLCAIVSRGFLTLIWWRAPIYIYILPLPLTLFVAFFLWLEGWLGQIWCVFFFYLTTWIYTCLGTLVPEGSLMCFMQQRLSLLKYNAWDGFLLVTWFDNTHTHTHTRKRKQLTQGQVDWHTHKSIN